MVKFLTIDGSQGEGGGQILRSVLSLSALLQQPVTVNNIRAKRSKSGLRPQHLAGVRALAEITGGELFGAHKNSTKLSFAPGPVRPGQYRFDIGTAGSTSLLLAALLPPLLFADAPTRLTITGGTHVPFSPTFHYLHKIFLPTLAQMGGRVSASINRWGWYPHGGGEIVIDIAPCTGLRGIQWLERGPLSSLELLVGLSQLPNHIAAREEERVKERLAAHGYRVTSLVKETPAAGPGNMLFLSAEFTQATVGFSALGRRGKPAESVADELCQSWFDFVNTAATVDRFLGDQLILYLALARGVSVLRCGQISRHLSTNIKVVDQFLPVRFNCQSATGEIRVTGAGFMPP